jgi:hypothetical protein
MRTVSFNAVSISFVCAAEHFDFSLKCAPSACHLCHELPEASKSFLARPPPHALGFVSYASNDSESTNVSEKKTAKINANKKQEIIKTVERS